MGNPFLKRNNVTSSSISFSHTEIEKFRNNPGDLVTLLFSLHEQKGLIPHFEFKAYVKAAKQFIELTGDKAPEIMIMASEYTKHAFTFKYLKEFYDKNYTISDE